MNSGVDIFLPNKVPIEACMFFFSDENFISVLNPNMKIWNYGRLFGKMEATRLGNFCDPSDVGDHMPIAYGDEI
ncbi:hypothetical protein ACJX0J_023283, partial [Zea mays]